MGPQRNMATVKPDQERVKNLLAETVTLLCKNGLTYESELRIEAVIGITVDANDVFLVHINDKFGEGFPPPEQTDAAAFNDNKTTAEVKQSQVKGECESDTIQGVSPPSNPGQHTQEGEQSESVSFNKDQSTRSDSTDIPKETSSPSTPPTQRNQTPTSFRTESPVFIKIEDDDDEEEEEEEEEDHRRLKSPKNIANQAFMVAGQRRVLGKRRYSGGRSGGFHQDGGILLEETGPFHIIKPDVDEPICKRPASEGQDFYNPSDGGPDSWHLGGDVENSQMYYNNSDSNPSGLPGCSSWGPAALAMSPATSDQLSALQWFPAGQPKRRSVRAVDQPYYCTILGCNKRYVNKRHLRRHERLDHGFPKRREVSSVFYTYTIPETESASVQSAGSDHMEDVETVGADRDSNISETTEAVT